jgi:hypothetical protein
VVIRDLCIRYTVPEGEAYYQLLLPVQYILYRGLLLPTSPSGTVCLIQRSLITTFSFRYSISYTEVSYYQILLPVQYILYRGLLLPTSPSGTVYLIQRSLITTFSFRYSISYTEVSYYQLLRDLCIRYTVPEGEGGNKRPLYNIYCTGRRSW